MAEFEFDPVPPYLSPADIAFACRLSWKATIHELKGAARAEEARSKRPSRLLEWRGRWRVSSSRLQELLPDMYDRVYAYCARHVGAFASRRRPTPAVARRRPL